MGLKKKREIVVSLSDDSDDDDNNNHHKKPRLSSPPNTPTITNVSLELSPFLRTKLSRHSQIIPPPNSNSNNNNDDWKNSVILLLKKTLREVHTAEDLFGDSSNDASREFHLCPSHTRLMLQGDSWSCGYENFRMVISALLLPGANEVFAPCFREALGILVTGYGHLPEGYLPSIRDLQVLIETGWGDGFDLAGKTHYGCDGVVGGRSWTGAMEFVHVLNFLGVSASVREFRVEKKLDNGRRTNIVEEMMSFVWGYFKDDEGGGKLPLCVGRASEANARVVLRRFAPSTFAQRCRYRSC